MSKLFKDSYDRHACLIDRQKLSVSEIQYPLHGLLSCYLNLRGDFKSYCDALLFNISDEVIKYIPVVMAFPWSFSLSLCQ